MQFQDQHQALTKPVDKSTTYYLGPRVPKYFSLDSVKKFPDFQKVFYSFVESFLYREWESTILVDGKIHERIKTESRGLKTHR